MSASKFQRISCFALMILAAGLLMAEKGDGPYSVKSKKTVGGEGGWDYLTVDSDAHRLNITRGTHVMVL
jgi:hypothetical protein